MFLSYSVEGGLCGSQEAFNRSKGFSGRFFQGDQSQFLRAPRFLRCLFYAGFVYRSVHGIKSCRHQLIAVIDKLTVNKV
jgi:hypothetical protein